MTAPTAPTALTARSARRRFLLLTTLRWLPTGLLVPITVLLALDRGLTLAEVGVVFSVQGFVVLALELPTGGLADSLGRRPVLVLAGGVGTAALAVLLVADSVATYVAALALQGVWRALDSGPLEAWYVDTALADEPAADIERGLSSAGLCLNGAVGVGALASGGLVALAPALGVDPLTLPVAVALALSAVSVAGVTLLVREARAPRAGKGALATSLREVPRTVGGGVRLLRSSRVLLALVAVELFWGFGMVAFETLTPARLADVVGGVERAGQLMGPVSAAAWLAAAGGAAVIPLASRRLGVAPVAAGLRVVQALTVVGLGLLAGPAGVVVAYLACYAAHGASNPMHNALLHRQATGENRAVVLSMNSMVAQPAGALGSLALGALASGASVSTAMLVGAVVLALAAPLYLPARRQERERARAAVAVSAARPPEPA